MNESLSRARRRRVNNDATSAVPLLRRSDREVKKQNNNHIYLGDGALQRAPWLDVVVLQLVVIYCYSSITIYDTTR